MTTNWPALLPLIRIEVEQEGKTLRQVSVDLGLSYDALKNRCRRNGIGSQRPHRKIDDADKVAIRRAVAAGTPTRIVGERFGISSCHVNRVVLQKDAPTGPSKLPTDKGTIVVAPHRLDMPREARPAAGANLRQQIANWRARGASDARIARELRLQASIATEYGLAVMDDTADPFGMDPRRRAA